MLLTGRLVFDRYSPSEDDPGAMLRQLVEEAHLMIKLTAISAEEEPHSTVATFVINPTLECGIAHAGDSRVYHFRDNALIARTKDHSFVQRLVDEGKLAPEEALTHPQANLLTGSCSQGLIDRHIFYNGRYISTELLPIQFVDFARSRPMTWEEANALLQTLFSASGWQ